VYKHPEASSLLRPEVGTQPQFRRKKPPVTYRYDSSLSPALDWDGQNSTREQGEALIREILETGSLEAAKAAASKLKAISKPLLNWAGKAERLSFTVPTLPLFVHERLSTKAILETPKGHRKDKQMDFADLFSDPRNERLRSAGRRQETRPGSIPFTVWSQPRMGWVAPTKGCPRRLIPWHRRERRCCMGETPHCCTHLWLIRF
jgi:hypothetical protein